MMMMITINDDEKKKAKMLKLLYSPPTNCSELAKLGYTLNGYYLIRNASFNQGSIDMTYCQFKQSSYFKKKNRVKLYSLW